METGGSPRLAGCQSDWKTNKQKQTNTSSRLRKTLPLRSKIEDHCPPLASVNTFAGTHTQSGYVQIGKKKTKNGGTHLAFSTPEAEAGRLWDRGQPELLSDTLSIRKERKRKEKKEVTCKKQPRGTRKMAQQERLLPLSLTTWVKSPRFPWRRGELTQCKCSDLHMHKH